MFVASFDGLIFFPSSAATFFLMQSMQFENILPDLIEVLRGPVEMSTERRVVESVATPDLPLGSGYLSDTEEDRFTRYIDEQMKAPGCVASVPLTPASQGMARGPAANLLPA